MKVNRNYCSTATVNTDQWYRPASKIDIKLNRCPKVQIKSNLKHYPAGTS